MHRREFLVTSTLAGSLVGCLRLEATGSNPTKTDSEPETTPPDTEQTTEDTDTTTEDGNETTTEEDDDESITVSGSWTAFGNDPSNVGIAASAAGVEEYEILWKQELPQERVAGPIIADGTVYTHGDGLVALDAATGKIQWTAPILGGRPTPTYVGDGIVTGNSSQTAFVDLDGSVRWQISSGGDGHAVTDEMIYTAGQGNVWAFDLAGNHVWSERIDERTTAVPGVANGILCVGTREGHIFGFDANSGDKKWTFEVANHSNRDNPAGYDVTGGVTIYDETAYFGTWDRTVYALDIENGDLQWMYETNGGIDVCPAAADGTIYVGNDGGRILAFDAATGKPEWASDRLGSSLQHGIALSDGVAYAVGNAGLLGAVDRSDGTMHWRHPLSNSRPHGSPAVADGYVFITDGSGIVHAFTES